MLHFKLMIDVGSIQGEEKAMLISDLHSCGLMPAVTPSIAGKLA